MSVLLPLPAPSASDCTLHSRIEAYKDFSTQSFFLKFVFAKYLLISYLINTRHVCTYLNADVMVIPNIVMKFNNLNIFEYLCGN